MSVRVSVIAAVFFSLSVAALADIDYTVSIKPVDSSAAQRMSISVTLPVRGATTSFQMPNWGPGSYVYPGTPFWQALGDIKVTGDGKNLTSSKPNDYTWTIPTEGVKKVTFSYTLPVQVTEEMGHYRGPASYIYVLDRKEEKCNLNLDLPAGWNIATGLDGTNGHFSAPTYDVLADNPVTFGKYREVRYTVDGRPHILAMYGPARNDVDIDKLVKACSFISAAENDLFGNKPPYTHYVWHFNVGKRADGGGGLEHLASTEITLANGLGNGIIGVNAHEFFHLWNVKRIRARVLGPFDYTKLPETGALWWLEGVTEYYAHQLMTRYGYWDDKKWYDTIVRNVANVRRVPARLTTGPYEASFRVKDAANGRGNSSGYQISYYDLGVLAGICLDTEIIAQTKGKYSLDDVERALWEECKDSKPGFEEGEIRNLCVKFGGPALGDMYDKIIMHGGEMPIEAQLAKVGLIMGTFDKPYTDIGVVTLPSFQSGGVSVSKVTGPLMDKLKVDDLITAVNGETTANGRDYAAAIAKVKPGDTVAFKVKRGADTMDVSVTAGTIMRQANEIHEDANASAEQLRLRNIWLYRGKKGWMPPAVK